MIHLLQNQYHDFAAFLRDIDIVVIMVAHDELKQNMNMLHGKIVLDTRHIYNGECYRL